MADGENNKQSFTDSDLRFKYIGFDVFPGKAGNIFKSEEERKTLIERVKAKLDRAKDEVRDRCTLMETRISPVEKMFLAVAAVVLVLALFVPWFSGYIPISYEQVGSNGDTSFYYASDHDQRVVRFVADALKDKHDRALVNQQRAKATKAQAAAQAAAAEDEAAAVDTAGAPAAQPGAAAEEKSVVPNEIRVLLVDTFDIQALRSTADLRKHVIAFYGYNGASRQENLKFGAEAALAAVPNLTSAIQANEMALTDRMARIRTAATEARMARGLTMEERQRVADSILADTAKVVGGTVVSEPVVPELAVKGIVNDAYSKSGLGALASIGTYGSMVFSSGFALMLTGILLIVYLISCLAMAAMNLYVLYGVKMANQNEYVLYLKKKLRLNWIPVLIWLAMLLFSLIGAAYGFDTKGTLKQVGDSYSFVTFMGLSSFGFYLTLAAFLITALKGKEI